MEIGTDNTIIYERRNRKGFKLTPCIPVLSELMTSTARLFADRYRQIRVTNKRKPIAKNYTTHGKTLELLKNTKYLGLNISHNLSWNHHIGTVSKKANNINAFLSRNISSCPSKVKTQCYTTLVRPIMGYASIIPDPVTQKNMR